MVSTQDDGVLGILMQSSLYVQNISAGYTVLQRREEFPRFPFLFDQTCFLTSQIKGGYIQAKFHRLFSFSLACSFLLNFFFLSAFPCNEFRKEPLATYSRFPFAHPHRKMVLHAVDKHTKKHHHHRRILDPESLQGRQPVVASVLCVLLRTARIPLTRQKRRKFAGFGATFAQSLTPSKARTERETSKRTRQTQHRLTMENPTIAYREKPPMMFSFDDASRFPTDGPFHTKKGISLVCAQRLRQHCSW